jgi:hypothetical protein
VSRGGNAMCLYTVNELQVTEANKNQAYAVVSLSCDAVKVVYHSANVHRARFMDSLNAASASFAPSSGTATRGLGTATHTPMHGATHI